jgi:uncharacterized protein YggE
MFALLFIPAAKAQTVDVSNLPTIQVTGTAEIQVVPDEVTFFLRVHKSDKSLVAAKAQNDENVKKILDLAKRFGIAAQDVKTDYISVAEKYDRVKPRGEEEYKSVFAGYTISKTVIVKLKNISRFEEFFSDVVSIGVTEIGNVSFESSQLRKFRDQARAMAIRAAKEKAEAIVKEIGQSIGKAVSIEEQSTGSSYANNFSQNVTSNARSRAVDSDDGDDGGGGETFSIGTIAVKAQVEVRFLLN